MRGRRLWIASLLAVGMALLLVASRVSAAAGRQGDECIIAVDETIETDLYVACINLTIAGTVEGDLIGGAWAASIAPDARIAGDIWLAGWQLQIDGGVGDDIHFMGIDLDVTDLAQLDAPLDVSALALNVEVWEGASVPGDLLAFGYQAVIKGEVGRDVSFNGSALVIEGEVQGDVFATVSGGEAIPFPFPFSVAFQPPGLTVHPSGRIGGNLTYAGPRPGNLNGRIGGEIDFELVLPRPDITQPTLETEANQPLNVIGSYLSAVLTDVLSMMAAGVLVLMLAPNWLHEPADLIPRRLPSSFGWGLILTPLAVGASLIMVIVSLVLLVLVALITLGGFTAMAFVLLTMLNVVVIGGLTFTILFLARLAVSMLIGRALGQRVIRTGERWAVNLLSLLLGVIVYAVITNLPIPQVWLLINGLGICVGLGAIALYARQLYQDALTPRPLYGAPTVTARPALDAPRRRPRPPAPPPDRGEPRGLGLDNLPVGFEWWDEEQEVGDQ